jgi:hypothetical protein
MKSNSTDDLYDSITVSTTTTRTYSLRHLDHTNSVFDQHLTLHSLVSFKEELSKDSGAVGNHLRILTNSGFVEIVGRPHEEVSSFAVLEKGTHKLDPNNIYDPTIKVDKLKLRGSVVFLRVINTTLSIPNRMFPISFFL